MYKILLSEGQVVIGWNKNGKIFLNARPFFGTHEKIELSQGDKKHFIMPIFDISKKYFIPLFRWLRPPP